MIERLFALFGIHLHNWTYYTEYDPNDPYVVVLHDMRECPGCGTLEQWVADCGAPGFGGSWLDVRER